jgi:hypothetical protein
MPDFGELPHWGKWGPLGLVDYISLRVKRDCSIGPREVEFTVVGVAAPGGLLATVMQDVRPEIFGHLPEVRALAAVGFIGSAADSRRSRRVP